MSLTTEARQPHTVAVPHVVGGRANPDFAYKPQLDGLRAVAVLAVVFYHGNASWMQGGFLGVDLFFVLSGYLITTLMLIESDRKGKVDLKQFWIRRAKRLLPAMFLMVTGCMVYGRFNPDVVDLSQLRGDALATLAYIANWWYIATGSSYFEQFTSPSLLKHTWSLAIEEQFYLFWPLVIAAGMRVFGHRRQRWLIFLLVLAGLSALEMAVLFDAGTELSRIYYGTDTRLQALVIGAFGAFVLHKRSARMSATVVDMASFGAMGVMVVMFIVVSDQAGWMYRGGFTLFAIMAAIVIGSAVRQPGSLVSRAAAAGPLPMIGRVSYGIYLWHWPVYVILGQTTDLIGLPLIIVDLAITSALAAASYNLLEMPIRRGVLTTSKGRVMAIASVVVMLGLVLSASGSAQTEVASAIGGDGSIDLTTGRGGPVPADSTRDPGDVAVLLVGDSVAAGLGNNFDEASGGSGLYIYNAGRVGCGVISGDPRSASADMPRDQYQCETLRPVWNDIVNEQQPDVVVMLPGGHEVFDHVVDGQVLEFGTPEFRQYLLAQMDENIALLTSSGARVILLTTPCFDQTKAGGLSAFSEVLMERTAAQGQRIAWLNGVWAEVAQRHPDRVTLADLNGLTCPGGQHTDTIDGEKLQVDGVHFTPEAAKTVWRWLGPQLSDQGN